MNFRHVVSSVEIYCCKLDRATDTIAMNNAANDCQKKHLRPFNKFVLVLSHVFFSNREHCHSIDLRAPERQIVCSRYIFKCALDSVSFLRRSWKKMKKIALFVLSLLILISFWVTFWNFWTFSTSADIVAPPEDEYFYGKISLRKLEILSILF